MTRSFWIRCAVALASLGAVSVAPEARCEPLEMTTHVRGGSTSNRRLLSAGVYLAVMGDPYPSLAGANLAVNVFDFLRLTGGIGGYSGAAGASLGAHSMSATATNYAAGVRVLMPSWSFSPMVGLSYNHLQINRDANVQGFQKSGEYWYGTLGLDWQSSSGFNVGAGCNVALLSAGSALPYINIGYFFPLI